MANGGGTSAGVARRELSPRLADMLDAWGAVLHGSSVAALLALFVAAAHLLTLEGDEAWILLSTARAFGVPLPPTHALDHPVVTTGGPHLLIHGLLGRLGTDLFVHRSVSLAATSCLLAGAYAVFRRLAHPPARAAAGTALVAATPGFLFQASLATGEALAGLFLLAAAAHWTARGDRTVAAAAVTGLLLGSAAAARVNCIMAVPGLFLSGALSSRVPAGRFRRLATACIVALVVAGVSALLYSSTAQATAGQAAFFSRSTGVGAVRRSVFQVLQSFSMANANIPAPLLAVAGGAWLVRRVRASGDDRAVDLAGLLLFMGAAMLAAWLLFAPIPLFRYLWPSLLCLWAGGAVLLLETWRTTSDAIARLTLHATAAVAPLVALLSGFSALANGETSLLVFQENGFVPVTAGSESRRFEAGADQSSLAGFVADRPADARFFTETAATKYPIFYLSGRAVEDAARIGGVREQYILLGPADFAMWRPAPAFKQWLALWAQPAFRAGSAAAYRVRPDAPPPPPGVTLIGSNDLY